MYNQTTPWSLENAVSGVAVCETLKTTYRVGEFFTCQFHVNMTIYLDQNLGNECMCEHCHTIQCLIDLIRFCAVSVWETFTQCARSQTQTKHLFIY